MNYYEVEAFLAIVRTQSISKASEIIHISQSATSQRLQSLEDNLGVTLINRRKGHRNIEMTLKGEEFLPIAERWMSIYHEALDLKQTQSKLHLVLSCMSSLNMHLFPSFYKQISNGSKDKSFSLVVRNNWSDEIYDLLNMRKIDIGFVSEQFSYKNIIVEPMFSERLYIVRLKHDEYKDKKSFHPSELDPQYEVFLEWDSQYLLWHNYWYSPSIKPYVYVDIPQLIPDFLECEKIWSVIPSSIKSIWESNERLQFFEIEDPPPDRITYKVTNRYPKASRVNTIRVFENYLHDFLSDIDYIDLIE
ncbi:LysR family transcriptional regulator [Wukongibacter baidiensis]|uniref:LysR family transcriptional regulator n=1 Tax=Wukongibacter baidiensis TaxID=1723361 RepID=UPI003D7F1FE4